MPSEFDSADTNLEQYALITTRWRLLTPFTRSPFPALPTCLGLATTPAHMFLLASNTVTENYGTERVDIHISDHDTF